jgi:hypothetical protein
MSPHSSAGIERSDSISSVSNNISVPVKIVYVKGPIGAGSPITKPADVH